MIIMKWIKSYFPSKRNYLIRNKSTLKCWSNSKIADLRLNKLKVRFLSKTLKFLSSKRVSQFILLKRLIWSIELLETTSINTLREMQWKFYLSENLRGFINLVRNVFTLRLRRVIRSWWESEVATCL